MKIKILVLIASVCIAMMCISSQRKTDTIDQIDHYYDTHLDSLAKTISEMDRLLKANNIQEVRSSFQKARVIYKKIEWENIPELNDKHYQVWISVTPNKNGKLKNIDWENTFMLIDNTIITDKENPFIKEALRIVRQIPDWNIVIRDDNILNQQILIVFNAQVKDKYAH